MKMSHTHTTLPPQVEFQGGEQEEEIEEEEEDENAPVIAPLGAAHDPDWGYWYSKCDGWSKIWLSLPSLDAHGEWPPNTRIVGGRMFIWTKCQVSSGHE